MILENSTQGWRREARSGGQWHWRLLHDCISCKQASDIIRPKCMLTADLNNLGDSNMSMSGARSTT